MENGFYMGLVMVLVAGCFSGVFSTPFDRNRKWAWENNWLIWSVVALIVCPAIAVSLTIPHVWDVYAAHPGVTAIIAVFGLAWGIGALLFGKGIDYLGVSLAIPIMQGLINAVGTVIPFFAQGHPGDLFSRSFVTIPIGVVITLGGIILFAAAGREKNGGPDAATSGKSFKKGLLIAILAGVLGPMINLGFVMGSPLQEKAVELGASPMSSANATWAVIFVTGFLVNAGQCLVLLRNKKTGALYKGAPLKNYLWAALAGIIWYGSILFYGMGCNEMGDYAASVGWAIMQATAILASGVAGLLMGEWKGASRQALAKMAGGMALLVAGMVTFSRSHASSRQKEPVDYVDTRIGTQVWKGQSTLSGPEEPMGFVYPGVGYPNAMVQLSPQTAKTDRCYFSDHPAIQGFRASHYPNGAAMSDYGTFTLSPTVGKDAVRPHERASAYTHAREKATPYYYSVELASGIKAELTGVSSSGMLRFTYPASDETCLVVDNARSEFKNFFHVLPGMDEVEGRISNEGRVGNQGYAGPDFACYFVARLSRPAAGCAIVPEPVFARNEELFPEGFSGEFYDNPGLEGEPVALTQEKSLDFDWEGSPAPGVPEDHFSVRYKGTLKARRSGKHIFYVTTDDSVRLFVDGALVVDSHKTHRPAADLYSVYLEEGQSCDMTIEYTEKTRLATVRLACLEPETRSSEELQKMALDGSAGAALQLFLPSKEGQVVEVRLGTSFISLEQARENLEAEIGRRPFDEVVSEGKAEWARHIGRIEVESSEENKTIFYTAMQRIELLPRNLTEGGRHYSAYNGKIMPGIMYTDYSLWDTFRALHPLLVILHPEKVNSMITGLLNSYDEGGWIPKWPSPGYSNIMTGTHGDAVIADAFVKGVRGFDTQKALEAMMKNATTASDGIYAARVGILDYIRLGYVPTDKYKESCVRTMEFAYDDWCIAQMAREMGREDLYAMLMERSGNYRNVLDPETHLIRGRNSDGSWRDPKDQTVSTWARGTDRDRETYYRNITFFVPHDVPGLIDFMGGKAQLESQLDDFFAGDFYYVGDEFSMHAPYLYNYTDAPWKTQKTVRDLVRNKFKASLGGLPGNDDCGQLSAWYIFSAMGFYPVCPALPVYQIGSPSFDKVTLHLDDGKDFTVVARGNSDENVYIQSATLNGKPYFRCWISHADIMAGGTLEFVMGPEPNPRWGREAGAPVEVKATDMGIVGDGKTLNTEAIQKAIDFCHAQEGGGELVFPEGKYLTGTVELKSGVSLALEKDAVILGSTNPYDYRAVLETKGGDNSALALIVADGASGIGIRGEGLIDGNGRALALAVDSLHRTGERIDPNYTTRLNRPNETARPKLFFISNSDHVEVEGLRLRNSACWGLSFDRCTYLTLKDLDFENRAYWNNDGIDVTDGKHVLITRCRINSADDGICLKSYHTDSSCDDIEVSDCDVISSASAVKFGTASWGGFRNIVIRDIRVKDTFRSAIAIESVDGGHIDNVLVENIHAENTGNAIFIRLGHRGGKAPGTLRNVTIRNLYVDIPFGRPDLAYDMRGPSLSFFHNPIPSSITGIPGHCVENVTLENVEVRCPGRASKGMAYMPLWRLDDIPEKTDSYPEFSMFGELPAYGLFVRHVRGLALNHVRFTLKDEDFRPRYVFVDAEGIQEN